MDETTSSCTADEGEIIEDDIPIISAQYEQTNFDKVRKGKERNEIINLISISIFQLYNLNN